MANQGSSTTSLPSDNTAGPRGSMLNLGSIIALVVLGAVLILVFIAFLVYRCLQKRSGPVWISKLSHRRDRYSSMNEEEMTTGNFIIGFNNPTSDAREPVSVLGYRTLHNDTSDVPGYKPQSEIISRDCLVYGKELGNGWFGKVYEGEAHRLKPGIRKMKVVMKELKMASDKKMKYSFFKEIEMFMCITHKNVLSIMGRVADRQPYLVVFEHFPLGDLKKFLQSHDIASATSKQPSFTLRSAIDIVSGLHCLHANSLYHRDLAARNCFVASDFSVKIGDYGISTDLYPNDYYRGPSQTSLPIRWMAPEDVTVHADGNLETRPPSETSNVWSFGVTLWEVVELGRHPYEVLTDQEVLQSVITDGLYKLPEPNQTEPLRDLLYAVMKQCWVEPERRPGTKDLESTLMSLMSNHSVPCLTTDKTNRSSTEPRDEPRVASQPVAVVHPMRPANDVPVTKILDETPPPVTYIGDLEEPRSRETSDVKRAAVVDTRLSDLVVIPGAEITRRRNSILRAANSTSKGKTVHFPANILALRTIYKYESTDMEAEDDEYDNQEVDDDDEPNDDDDDRNEWPRNYPITSEKVPAPKELCSPVEKKIKKASRRAKLEGCATTEGEWLAVLEIKEESNASDSASRPLPNS